MELRSAIRELVWQEYGVLPFAERAMNGTLKAIASRQHWRLVEVPDDSLRSFRVLVVFDRTAHPLWTLLIRENMLALVHADDTAPLMTGRRYLTGGPLWDALSNTEQFIMLDPPWLSADLTPVQHELLRLSPDPWEAYSVRYWQPRTRGDVLFNGWD